MRVVQPQNPRGVRPGLNARGALLALLRVPALIYLVDDQRARSRSRQPRRATAAPCIAIGDGELTRDLRQLRKCNPDQRKTNTKRRSTHGKRGNNACKRPHRSQRSKSSQPGAVMAPNSRRSERSEASLSVCSEPVSYGDARAVHHACQEGRCPVPLHRLGQCAARRESNGSCARPDVDHCRRTPRLGPGIGRAGRVRYRSPRQSR